MPENIIKVTPLPPPDYTLRNDATTVKITYEKRPKIENQSNQNVEITPIVPPPPDYSCKADATYVQGSYKSFVGVGNTPLDLEKLKPEFRGFIIFVNGYIPAPWDNAGSTLWNATMDKSPEREEGWNGGRNADMEDHTANRDRYKEIANSEEELEYKENESLEKSEYRNQNEQSWWYSEKNKQRSYWEYWNNKENNFRFSLDYSKYFRSRGNVYYINGSHGLESSPDYRMEHGIKQGYAWAEENYYLIEKAMYDTFIKFTPWLQSPEYVPITLVLHSQGNAKGIGVAKGIMQYAKKQGWNKIAINIVMLSVHQNVSLTGSLYDKFKEIKLEMMANKYWKNSLPSLFEKNKLKKETGIDEYAQGFFEDIFSWSELKKHAVQFTFVNDRGDLVMRMGDIPGIANACHNSNVGLLPFIVDDLGNLTYATGRFLENHEGPSTKIPYKKLVENYAKAYERYKTQKKYYDHQYPSGAFFVGANGSIYDELFGYAAGVSKAYGKIFEAEVNTHGAPIKWGLHKKNGKEWIIEEEKKSILDLIKDKGDPLFYRDLSHSSRIITIK